MANKNHQTQLGQTFNELGLIGQNRYAGIFQEEFLKELTGRRGVETYKEMSENDDIIGAMLFAMKNLIREVTWDIKAMGNTQADKRARDFVFDCMYDMDETWNEFISEVLSFLVFGWSYHEIVYKRRMGKNKNSALRSKYSDGLIGWRKLPIRSQDTFWQWVYDDQDNLRGMVQMPPPNYRQIFIPIEKALHFKTENRKENPEGRSILRSAYKSWYHKKHIQRIESVGIERDLVGLPYLQAPAGVDLFDTTDPQAVSIRAVAEAIVQNIRRDEREGVVLPAGWELKLLSADGKRQFDTNEVIKRYDTAIASTVLADFLRLGHESVGSFALSVDKTKIFFVALGMFIEIICEVFNKQAIPRLIDLNGDVFSGITDYPELVHGDIGNPNLKELGEFVERMVKSGVIIPDSDLEDRLRVVADLPERMADVEYLGVGQGALQDGQRDGRQDEQRDGRQDEQRDEHRDGRRGKLHKQYCYPKKPIDWGDDDVT